MRALRLTGRYLLISLLATTAVKYVPLALNMSSHFNNHPLMDIFSLGSQTVLRLHTASCQYSNDSHNFLETRGPNAFLHAWPSCISGVSLYNH